MMTREIVSRPEARARGLARYFTGKPCVNGHTEERRTSTGDCLACKRDAANARYAANPERFRAEIWTRRSNDPEQARAYQRERYAKNPEKFKVQNREWYAANKDWRLAANSQRRARKLNATPDWGEELTDFVAQEAADLAAMRERITGFAWHVDHMVPLQARRASGLHTWSNLQVIPARLNLAKGNRLMLTHPGEWVAHV